MKKSKSKRVQKRGLNCGLAEAKTGKVLAFSRLSSPAVEHLTPVEAQRASEEGWSRVVAQVKAQKR
jgi:hypothetical protein